MILYLENPKESAQKFLEIISMIVLQGARKIVFSHTSN